MVHSTLLSSGMGAVPRPSLRRRSQSEQPTATKASPARSVTWKDDKEKVGSQVKVQERLEQARPVTTSPLPGQGKRTATPSTPASAAPVKTGRRVLFSTPHSHSSAHNIPRPSQLKAEVPPPYTPMNSTLLPGMMAGPPPHHPMAPGHLQHGLRMGGSFPSAGAPASVSPSVLAASEALRINLGLDPNQPFQPTRRPEPMPPLMTGPLAGAPPTSIYNKTPSTSVQTQLLSSLYPVLGQLQPVVSQSPNLPPIVNTGACGPMKVQPGDWSCLVCSFVNWRRRKTCMRCCPFAEGNMANATGIVASPAAAGYRSQMQAPMSLAMQHALPVYATPPRHHLNPASTGAPLLPMMNPAYMPAGYPMYGLPGFSPLRAPMPMPGQPYHQSAMPMDMPLPSMGFSTPLAGPADINRPLTPSPTGSDSSGCSFAFSNVSITGSPDTAVSPSVCSSSNSSGSASPSTPRVDCFEPHRSSPKMQETLLSNQVQIVQ